MFVYYINCISEVIMKLTNFKNLNPLTLLEISLSVGDFYHAFHDSLN